MKKLLSVSLASVLAASMLAACGGSSAPATTAAAAAAPATTAAAAAAAPATTAAAAETTAAAAAAGAENIRIICPYGAGGTADAIARKYAAVANGLQSQYNFYVENLTGGDGFAAASEFCDYPEDTKDLLVYGYGVAYRHDIGKAYDTEEVDFDRSLIQPVATVDDRTWILYTTPDQSLESILAKAADGGIKMSGGNPLSDPHLALGSLLAVQGGKVQVVPYDGGANQLKGLTDGEVDVFVGTTQAAQEYVEAGTVIPILAFSENTFDGFKTPNGAISVPSIAGDGKAKELAADKDFTGSILCAGGSIAVRTGAPQEWVDSVVDVSKKVWASSEYTDWIASILLNKYECYGDDAVAHYTEACDKAMAAYKLMSGN